MREGGAAVSTYSVDLCRSRCPVRQTKSTKVSGHTHTSPSLRAPRPPPRRNVSTGLMATSANTNCTGPRCVASYRKPAGGTLPPPACVLPPTSPTPAAMAPVQVPSMHKK